MKNKIDYIIENDRFPLAKTDWIFLIGIYIFLISLTIFGATYVKNPYAIIGLSLFLIILCFAIYTGFVSSLTFKKINTGFTEEQNKKLILLCLNHLKFKLFQDQSHDNVYVCFVHNLQEERQEIYLIAKDNYILINSNKEKGDEEENGRIDFVDKIGLTIYKTAIALKKRQNK